MALGIDNSRKAFTQARRSIGQSIRKDANEIGQRAKDAFKHGKERLYESEEKIENYVSDNPKKSVLIAATVGAVVGAVLLGSLIRRRD